MNILCLQNTTGNRYRRKNFSVYIIYDSPAAANIMYNIQLGYRVFLRKNYNIKLY